MRKTLALATTALTILCAAGSAGAAVKEANIYAFTGNDDGSFPHAGLIGDAKGNLYGTTSNGGANHAGAVFELSPPKKGETAWTETTLYAFTGANDGGNP